MGKGSGKSLKEIKWIKINTDMLDDEKIRLIDTDEKRDLIHYIWVALLIYAGRTNKKGLICDSDGEGYNEEMLAVIFRRSPEDISYAINVLKKRKLITVDENNVIEVINFKKHQNIEGMERARELTKERVRKYRERKKLEQEDEDVTLHNVTVTKQNKNKNKKENKNIKKKNKKKKFSEDCDENTLNIREFLRRREKGEIENRGYCKEVEGDMRQEYSETEESENYCCKEELI